MICNLKTKSNTEYKTHISNVNSWWGLYVQDPTLCYSGFCRMGAIRRELPGAV